ncbi:MAG: CbtA family protein [Gammaproteobacteria bacterium]|nr:CbtA family protein [Gammaproteobacteria bacterium]
MHRASLATDSTMLFRRIVLCALLVGALAGSLLSAIQLWQVIPIIHRAEHFEQARTSQMTEPAREVTHGHKDAGHAHPAGEWEPAEGAERMGYTLLANVLTAIGFALVMLVGMASSLKLNYVAKLDWRYGLLWGVAGYAIFFVAPSLGLPPEIPGAATADQQARQLWWLLAVVCTATGLAVVAFSKIRWRWVALGLLVVPYLVGAPHLATGPFADYPPPVAAELADLAQQFFWATALANALYWLVLGSASAWAVRRFLKEAVT